MIGSVKESGIKKNNRYIEFDDNQNGAAWIVTLGDLLALVITFFVLLYSMSTVVQSDWQQVSQSFSQTLNTKNNVQLTAATSELSIDRVEIQEGSNLQYLLAILNDKTSAIPNLRDSTSIRFEDERIIISLEGKAFFNPSKSTLNRNAGRMIRIMGQSLSTVKNSVEIVSYVSPLASRSEEFPSGWELALARAISVLNDLRKGGYPYRISAFGQSSQNNDDASNNRQGNSQRIDIVVREDKATF